MLEIRKVECDGYGYEISNPIKAMSALGSYAYLNSLKAKEGVIVKWERQGAYIREDDNKLIDKYSVFVLVVGENPELQVHELFIDMYHRINDEISPKNFEITK